MTMPFVNIALGLAQFAPVIKNWLSGNNSEKFAEIILDLAKKITKKNNPEYAVSVIKNNDLMISEFKNEINKLENEFRLKLLEDVAAARNRDIEFIRKGTNNKRADLMVLAAAFGLIICLLSISFYSEVLPGEAVGIISTIAGIFGSCLKDAYAFEFGSSRGSKIKDSTVRAFLEKF